MATEAKTPTNLKNWIGQKNVGTYQMLKATGGGLFGEWQQGAMRMDFEGKNLHLKHPTACNKNVSILDKGKP